MGVEALLHDEYVADFSAKVVGEARVLKITRDQYIDALNKYPFIQ